LLTVAGLPATKEGDSKVVPVLPRNLAGPEWVRFGMASFFETPRTAYWAGAAVPSWMYLLNFQMTYKGKDKLDGPAKLKILQDVITDQYFNAADGGKNKEKLQEARTLAWSLNYYLAKHHLNSLEAYFRQLSKLPRNMKFDRRVLKDAFVKAFFPGK